MYIKPLQPQIYPIKRLDYYIFDHKNCFGGLFGTCTTGGISKYYTMRFEIAEMYFIISFAFPVIFCFNIRLCSDIHVHSVCIHP